MDYDISRFKRNGQFKNDVLVKIRGYGLCCVVDGFYNNGSFFNNEKLIDINQGGISSTERSVKGCCDVSFDIIAIKTMRCQKEALSYVLTDTEPDSWDLEESPEPETKEMTLAEVEAKLGYKVKIKS